MSTPKINKQDQNTRVKLSYSSMTTLQSCEQKYAHYKVLNSPKDSDYEESDALGLGKAFHQVLEKNLHKEAPIPHIIEAMTDHKVDASDMQLLTVMLDKYVAYRKASGIRVIKCELALSTSEYNGFIDYIAVKGDEWYIGDLKTAGRHDETILSRLPLDPQLNLYAHFCDELYIACPELVGKRFAGCLYSQTTKSKAGTIKGLESGVKVFEMFVPIEVMNPDMIWSLFNEMHTRALEIHAGEAPKKNLGSCMAYFSPCQYFSQCHGKNFSENKFKVTLNTINSLTAEMELL
jgi:hypothetical protein